jgi:hypothetical protein
MNDYRIFQAQILAKDPVTPRQYSVVEIPNGQKLVGVQLGNALKDQSAPLLGSLVLVLQLDAYRSYILMVLREPYSFLSTNNQYAGFIPSTGNVSQDIAIGANPIQDGEIFMEATGPSSPTGQGIPGFGAHLYLGNNGVAQIESGSMSEKLIIGGEGSSDDHEVILTADNGYFESNSGTDNIQSTFNYTTNSLTGLTEGLQVATQISTPTGTTSIEIPICQLTMDTIGNISLNNTTLGTGVSLASLKLNTSGNAALVGTTISLNGGTEGVARLKDLTTSNLTIDPVFWPLITALQAFFTSLASFQGGSPVLQSQLGALGAAFLAQVPIVPTSLTSQISTSSVSVTAGN